MQLWKHPLAGVKEVSHSRTLLDFLKIVKIPRYFRTEPRSGVCPARYRIEHPPGRVQDDNFGSAFDALSIRTHLCIDSNLRDRGQCAVPIEGEYVHCLQKLAISDAYPYAMITRLRP